MQFIQNKIRVGKSKSFEDICQEFIAKKNANVKTASVKVAEADEAPSSGQLAVEPLHQEGESTNQDSVAGGKDNEGGDGGKAPTKKADEEGKDSGQPKAEGSEKFTNDPKVEANADATVKVAEVECEECKCDPCTCKEATATEEEEKEAKSDEDEVETKEAGVKGNCAKCSKPNFLCKCKGDGDSDSDDDKSDDKEEKEDKEASADATVKVAFKKIANLTPAEKTRLGTYWKNIYPDAFVDALLADK
jgi:hypothetical protein